ncbi:MAG: hypothetical protein V3W43_13350 [Desulfatiglandaceae bacterium]
MNSRISRGIVVIGCCVLVGSLFSPKMLVAGPDIRIEESDDVEFFEFQCTIMEVHPRRNYLIVGEKKIELVDLQKGTQLYRTILRDSNGKTIPLSSFKKGQWVFIRGFRFLDGRIAAREIYQLPGMVTGKDLGKYPFFKNVPVWEPVPTTP